MREDDAAGGEVGEAGVYKRYLISAFIVCAGDGRQDKVFEPVGLAHIYGF